ncbi:MAG: T9SS type A sorting domain-containing protein [Chitinophagales bacterium]
MRKFIILFFSLVLVLFSTFSFAGIVDMRFTNPVLNSNEGNIETYCVHVQIKAQDISFEIGSATVFFSYNAEAITKPSFTSIHFNEQNKCAMNGATAPYQNSFNSLESNTKGEGNYAILLNTANMGCPTVTNDWVDVAEFCFEVKNKDLTPNLQFNTKYTAFNTNDNQGNKHELGALEGLDDFTTDIDDLAEKLPVRFFPNYTNSVVNIEYTATANENLTITVYDMLGRTIQQERSSVSAGKSTTQINLAKHSAGYYFVELDNGSQKVSEKIVLTK